MTPNKTEETTVSKQQQQTEPDDVTTTDDNISRVTAEDDVRARAVAKISSAGGAVGNRKRTGLTSQPSMLTTLTLASDVFYNDGESIRMAFDQLVVILSGLYGILLIVLGLVLPITEAMCNARNLPALRFELFYIYLYLISMLFLVYVYTYLLRNDGALSLASVSGMVTRSFRKSSQNSESADAGLDTSSAHPSTTSTGRARNTKIGFMSTSTGSFYLRMGAMGFGVGSMIHSAIMFGHFLEMSQADHPCSGVIQALKPFTHMCFTFSQMYFVFMNSKVSIHKNRSLARFGLMHMCGTNICVWLRSIVVETLHVMKSNAIKQHMGSLGGGAGGGGGVDGGGGGVNVSKTVDNNYMVVEGAGHLPELKCHSEAVMGRLQESSSVYLFPCTIEYSLICAGVLCVMWYNVTGTGQRSNMPKSASFYGSSSQRSVDDYNKDTGGSTDRRTHRMSVDCASSSQGLFLGLAVFVGALCCLIWFYVIIRNSNDHSVAGALLGHLSEDFIYFVTLIAIFIAAFQMKDMRFTVGFRTGIDEVLTLVSLGGLGLFGVFSIVASMFHLDTLDGKLTVMTNVVMLLQAGCQATFILACLNVSAINDTQASHKPGRNCVTFLLVSNFTLWILNTFETQSLEHNVVQVEFYGPNAWSIFSHISVPLGIYYRFHSTVCLSNIWKNAWKTSKGDNP